jgi:glycosyltransferase involved in cell wall biosynthesis
MRILMISDVYFPRVNGVSTSIQTFALELLKLGHEITLIAPEYGIPKEEPFEIIRIPARPVPLDPEDRLMSYRAIARLEPELRAQNFDLVHIHTPFVAHYAGNRLARRLGLKSVETYHTFFEEYFDKYIPWLPSSWLRFVARRFSSHECNAVDSLIVPSTPMLDVLRDYGVETPAHVLPTGVRLEQFCNGDGGRFRRQYGIPTDRPMILFVGRVSLEKNIEFLLQVAKELKTLVPDLLFVIAGEGPARKTLQEMVNRQGLADTVLFIGYLNRQGPLEDCYSAADLFVFASRTETQGLVLLEAMAMGTPVVSTAVMGTRDVLVDGKGCVVAKEEILDFTNKIARLLKAPEQRAKLSESAREYVEDWSAPSMARRLESLYMTLVKRSAIAGEVETAGLAEPAD